MTNPLRIHISLKIKKIMHQEMFQIVIVFISRPNDRRFPLTDSSMNEWILSLYLYRAQMTGALHNKQLDE